MVDAPTLSPDGLWYWSDNEWKSLLSADGRRRWDGKTWVPVGASVAANSEPVAAAVAPAKGGIRWPLLIVGGAVLLAAAFLVIAGAYFVLHISSSVKVTGAASVTDMVNEQSYNTAYQRDVLKIQADTVPYAATASSPGVCNKGGTKQGCYDTDQKVMGDLKVMLTDLGKLTVPPRFNKANTDLRQGLQVLIDGLNLRDKVIAGGDPSASLDPSNQKLQEATDLQHKAYLEFPADNAPLPKL
jgi:hypothetical protein